MEPIIRNTGLAGAAVFGPIPDETPEQRFLRLLGHDDVVRALRLIKIDKLLTHYGLSHSPRDWPSLALCLAIDFVPGMEHRAVAARGQGRPRKRDGTSKAALYKAVMDCLERNKKMSVSSACAIISKQSGPWKGIKAETLRTRFYEAKREIQSMLASLDP